MGGLVDFAGQLCETLNRTTGQVTVITDRDSCIAVAGVPRRELAEKAISPQMERLMEGRQVYQYKPGEEAIPPVRRQRQVFPVHRRAHPLRGGRAGLRPFRRHGRQAHRRRGGVQTGPVHRRFSGTAHGELKKIHRQFVGWIFMLTSPAAPASPRRRRP